MGNLGLAIGPLSPCGKGGEAKAIRRSPSGAPLRLSPTSTSPDRNGPEQVLGMVRNDCSGSIGIGARNQTGINARNGPVRAPEMEMGPELLPDEAQPRNSGMG
jgi:hypothetical protein